MTDQELRPLSAHERAVLDRLLQEPFPGREELSAQLKGALVRVLDSDGSLKIVIPAAAPLARVSQRVPVEGEGLDRDGVTVHILLHVIDGRATELEVYKEDSSSINVMPEAERLKVWAK